MAHTVFHERDLRDERINVDNPPSLLDPNSALVGGTGISSPGEEPADAAGGGLPPAAIDTGAYQDWLDLVSFMSGGSEFISPGAQNYFDVIDSGSVPGPDYPFGGGFVQQIAQTFGSDFGGGGGGGPMGSVVPPKATFSEADLNVSGAPEWWQALIPDITNPVSSYQTLANLLIPVLSPEDQRTVASNLFQSDPEAFGAYNPELLQLAPIPDAITPDLRQQFFSGDRAQKTLESFDKLLEVSGKKAEDFGPGFNFLRGLADTLGDFKLTSGARQLSETQQGSLLSALDPQLAQTKNSALSAFGPIAKSFVNPFFSAGSLTGNVRTQFGDVISPPNPRFF